LDPLVSIGIPFYNAENYIIQTLESVKSQFYKNIELLLYDDASTDNSLELVQNWLTLNHHRFIKALLFEGDVNRGVGYASKYLSNNAKGIYFQKLDADDIILCDKLSKQVSFLEYHPNISMVYSNVFRIDSLGFKLEKDYFSYQKFKNVSNQIAPSGFIFDYLLEENFIPASSVLLRLDCINSIGGYDDTLFSEDWDLWLRISTKYEIQFLSGFTCEYRIHSQSAMQNTTSLIKVFGSLNSALIKHLSSSLNHKQIISKHIYMYSVGMFRLGYIDMRWLKINFKLNRNIKSFVYLLIGFFKIPFGNKN
jgi:glycosyltransferase involved in cell wall biosynthesis